MNKVVACTGFFDGVHKGHIKVFDKLKSESARLGLPCCVITFWPHPRIVLGKDPHSLRLLTSLDEKKGLIEAAGISDIRVIPFTKEFSETDTERFVSEFLVKQMGVAHLCVGYDHRIGKGGEAGYLQINEVCQKLGISTTKVEPLEFSSEDVSSSKIRHNLASCELEAANNMLGYNYFLSGKVIEGNKIGREIGFPTANIELHEPLKLVPAKGVYAAEAEFCGEKKQGMLYIGNRPTVDNKPTIEINLFDFDQNIYGQNIRVSLQKYMRGDMKFDNLDALKQQLNTDKADVIKALKAIL